MKQLLIVEDDLTLNQGLCKALKGNECSVVSCENIGDAREQLSIGTVSCVILDINLPDGSGLDFLSEIKNNNPDIPVILLTANDTDKDVVYGFDKGADDYITKPFSLSVLRARVNNQLRRINAAAGDDIFEDGEYRFDFKNMIFCMDSDLVEISKTEQKLLRILTENIGHTVTRETLIDRIWTDGAEYVDENALSVAIKRLRDKLHASDRIKTVYGLGYCWVKKDE